jgi:type I restriction enzyme S subunit
MSSRPRLGDLFSNRQEPGRAGLPVMSVTMNDSLVLRDDLERRMESTLRPDQHLLVKKGDIAYNMMRMWQGACGLATADGIVSPAYVVLAPKAGIESGFAYHWFKSARMIHLFWAYSHGLTEDRLRLYFDEFAEIPLAPPSLQKQRKIVTILDAWDQAIDQTERLIEAKRQQFEGMLRATIGLKQHAGSKSKRWSRVELGERVDFKSGGTPNRSNIKYWNGDIPWISAKDLKSFNLVTSQDMLTESGAAEVTLAPIGAILVLVRGMGLFKDLPLGIASRPLAFNQDIKAVIPKPNVEPRFLGYALRSIRRRVMDRVDRAGHGTGRLPTDILETLPIAFPDLGEQRKIAALLDVVEARIAAFISYRDRLRAQKRGLMETLLTDERLLGDNFR